LEFKYKYIQHGDKEKRRNTEISVEFSNSYWEELMIKSFQREFPLYISLTPYLCVEKRKEPQKRPLVLTNYRTKTYYSIVLQKRLINKLDE